MNRISCTSIASFLFLALSLLFLTGCGEEELSVLPVIGKPAPAFTLMDLQGKEWKLSDLQGKVVLLNFWASWCAPCLEEMPSMVSLNGTMPGEVFQMVTILYNDRPDYAQKVVDKAGATFPVLLDPDSEIAMQYGLTGVPETFIIDPEGILQQKFIGPRDWQSMDSVAIIEHYYPKSYKKIVQ